MKKSIFLLFVLLIGCAPDTTVPPTATAPPPTITPNATTTPEPTPTPEPTATLPPYQETSNGVQILENGRYINLKPPEGLWGNIDGMKVVLQPDENGEMVPFAQMTLENGFVNTDGDNIINIAKYSKAVKKWTSVPFSFARTPEWGDEFNNRNYTIQTHVKENSIQGFFTWVVVLGLKVDPESPVPVEVLARYKSRVAVFSANEISIYDRRPGKRGEFFITQGRINLDHLIQLVDSVEQIDPADLTEKGYPGLTGLSWDYPSTGTQLSDCEQDRYRTPSAEFVNWCKSEVSKGKARKIPTQTDIEHVLLFDESSVVFSNDPISSPNEFWDLLKSKTVSGTWLTFLVSLE